MPDLLLELFSEEIPARMQRRAAEDLRKLVTDGLVEAGLVYEGAKAFATPRRLALTVHGLSARAPDRREERKGPRVGAPQGAIDGFLKAAGLASIEQAKVQQDKKGDFYVAVTEKPGRPAPEVVAEIVPAAIRAFPWPKSMRWGDRSEKPGSLVWVRPLHSILCTFGPETEATEIVEFEVGGIRSGNTTFGHRFMATGPIVVRRFDDYATSLEKAKVVLDADRRKDLIVHAARDQAFALGLELVEDEALLEEAAGLVEWPVVLVGAFDPAFLAIPPEVIRATIRANQKCFVLSGPGAAPSFETRPASAPQEAGRVEQSAATGTSPHHETRPASAPQEAGRVEKSAATGKSPHPEAAAQRPSKDEGGRRTLSNRFILVANIEASDGGKAIVAGNERVIRARLSDARHFWETDLGPLPDYRDAAEKPLDQRLAKLRAQNIVFHEKLGTQGERVERLARLARQIAPLVGADPDKAERAASLAKADLVSEMVGEFPELQGLMGRYYATAQGEDPSVAIAIEEHYKPVGPADRVPTDPVAIAVALADKLDTLVDFFAIDEKPTGSKDPYALRRAALGVIRIVLSNALRLRLKPVLGQCFAGMEERLVAIALAGFEARQDRMPVDDIDGEQDLDNALAGFAARTRRDLTERSGALANELLAFFADRLKVQLREQGARHDLVDAVLALGQGAASSFETRPAGAPHDEADVDLSAELALGALQSPHPEAAAKRPSKDEGARANTQDDLLLIVRRVEALGRLLDTDDGKNLLAGYRRAANILRDEEKKTRESFAGEVDPDRFVEPEERALFEAIGLAESGTRAAVAAEDFDKAMAALAKLRAPVDSFFGKVLVNAEDPAIRINRLRLLNRVRQATLAVADFGKIAG